MRYLDTSAIGQRTVELLPLWDGTQWCLWIPAGSDLRETHPSGAAMCDYVALAPAADDDLCIPFVDIIWQRASWEPALRFLKSAHEDIHNLGTSLAKIDYFFRNHKAIGFGVGAFVSAEVEYVFTVARSLFDLAHELIREVWQTKVSLHDGGLNQSKKRAGLPKSIADVVLQSGTTPRSPADLRAKYSLSSGLAGAYSQIAPFFLALRGFRDAVVHGGTSADLVLVTDRGFCLDKTRKPFKEFPALAKRGELNEKFSSLRPLLAHVVFNTINSCNVLANGLIENIELAPEIAPGYRVFVRGPHYRALLDAKRIDEGEDPWWTPDSTALDRPLM